MSDFPKQFVPDSEKNEEWCEKNIKAIVAELEQSNAEGSTSSYDKDVRNYRLYNGDLIYDDYSYVTEQYKMTSPATMGNYPLSKNKIELFSLGSEITESSK